ncbi:hypothetical protein [Spirosoma sordidisoli]|uniref:Uncharacterized protein n=1 Tax=Spirosoma sordidisoli TaxID=2502893 RepID=A0A4Q2UUW0_9BACT|nr:hypothetical protein [Spirosoma sordidisoli]RYC70689.1 hypothetical protein EQG79_00625 [Spirosoma sordidisoli]
MLVFYTPDKGFGWPITVLDHPDIKPLVNLWGDAALHYACWFAHPISLHSKQSDLELREKEVIEHMTAMNQGHVNNMGRTLYPTGLYKDDAFVKLTNALLELPSIPDVTNVAFLKRKLAQYQKQEDSMVWKKADHADFPKQVTAAKNLRGLINETAKELSEAEARLQKMIAEGGTITLDQLWNAIL